ncbi:hypothetical protein [Mesorhizobium opportunistum]|uniref:hypothetical protein n=1 Tax=Mesorhizobium opportunistum TaxID=593909 RepID=UPI001427EAA6|nr:hypothetical protein [Mesorhizobium opportunistum]
MRLATTANIALSGLQTIDGVATEVGDRVLVKNQADASENGIYTASEGQWFRAADARTARTMQKGTTVHVQQGAVSSDFVYAFETLNPVIGTDAITLAFFLSEDTLGDATAAATAAASSAAAALTSKNAAATSATNAGTSATAASGSATAAAGSASTAATSATNAGTSASAASGSASGAATSATNAGNSATAAAGSASAASGSATAASTSATNAATSATNAATSATAAANSVAALSYTFSTTTADADPGNGALRLNNASAASATAAYVDNLDAGGATVNGILDTFDDSTNTIKGQLMLRSKASAAISYVYNVTGTVVDGSGYRKLTLAYVSGSGALPTTAGGIWLMFDRTGDKGADGLGAGDFTGPASSVSDNIVTFNGTSGKAGKDSGIKASDLIAGPASAVADNIATFNGTTGKIAKDSGVAVSSLAPKASPTFTGVPAAPTAAPGTNTTQLATTGFVKAAIDVVLGGVSTTFDTLAEIAAALGLLAPIASPTFTGAPAAPTAAPGTNTTQLATTAFVASSINYSTGNAALVAGGIGTYSLCATSPAASLGTGQVVAGSTLKYSHAAGNPSGTTSPPGSWQCMSATSSTGGAAGVAVFLRVS